MSINEIFEILEAPGKLYASLDLKGGKNTKLKTIFYCKKKQIRNFVGNSITQFKEEHFVPTSNAD